VRGANRRTGINEGLELDVPGIRRWYRPGRIDARDPFSSSRRRQKGPGEETGRSPPVKISHHM